MADYLVIRQHFGDKQYWQGDVRRIDDVFIAKQLLSARLIAPLNGDNPSEKAERKVRNKARTDVQNKADV